MTDKLKLALIRFANALLKRINGALRKYNQKQKGKNDRSAADDTG